MSFIVLFCFHFPIFLRTLYPVVTKVKSVVKQSIKI